MKRFAPVLFGSLLLGIGLTSPALAEVDWEVKRTYKPTAPVIDVATAVDGSQVYMLTEGGKVMIYSGSGKLDDTIDVDPATDQINVTSINARGRKETKLFLTSTQKNSVQEISVDFIVNINTKGSPFLGLADAPVEIVVFSDFE